MYCLISIWKDHVTGDPVYGINVITFHIDNIGKRLVLRK